MEFLLFNKYIYYTLVNTQTNTTYHGIYDIKLNKIMFNTNESINKFIPYSEDSMLAITDKTAYRICAIQDASGSCTEECSSDQYLLFDIDGNKCKDIQTLCDADKFLLIPENICIDYCDTNIYIIKDNQCGLCQDFDSTKPYRIIGSSECLHDYPDNTLLYNSKIGYGLFTCQENYHLYNNSCTLNCLNENCLTCSIESNKYKLCLTCNEAQGFYKVNYNDIFYDCLKSDNPILEKFYYNELLNEYKPCYKLCKKCYKEGNDSSHMCEICEANYMLKPGYNPKNICVEYSEFYYISNGEYHPLSIYQCPLEANFYIRNKSACIDYCFNDDNYKYLYKGDCIESCPSDTINDNYICKFNTESCSLIISYILHFDNNEYSSYIKPLINAYIYEYSYTNNAISEYITLGENYPMILIFKNISCIQEKRANIIDANINNILNYLPLNSIIFCIIVNNINGEEKFKYLFFDANTGEEIDINRLIFNYLSGNTNNAGSVIQDTIIMDEDPDQKIINDIKSGNCTEIISNFDGNNIITTDEIDNKVYEVSYLSNQTKNISYINLGYCEQIIKSTYGLENEELIIIKIEQEIDEFNIPIIDYLIFDQKGNALSLNCCANTPIEYEIPVTINESEVYKYDPKSFYYNDICYPAQSDNGIDITVYDRQNNYNNKNLALCQSNCEFKKYDYENKRAICECEAKNELNFDDIFNIDKDKLLKSFISIKNLINLDVIKCYKLIFYENGLLKNYGNYIILSIILITIISSIILLVKEFTSIKNLIQNIVNKETINDKISLEEQKIEKKNINSLPSKKKKGKKIKIKKSKTTALSSIIYLGLKNSDDTINIYKIIKLNDYEKNNLPYQKAITVDQRTYWEYYKSLIKTKQLIIFSFFLSTDYNLRTIKICLFFLTLALNLTVNALFFNDSTMHKIYTDNGSYNFLYQLPQILYSLIISVVIKTILSFLSLTEKSILILKEGKKNNDENGINNNSINNKYESFIRCIKIKLIIFFALDFIFLLAFWYYLSCFCALYKNTQIHLIKDTLSSFALSLLYPFFLNFIPGFFRISALKKKDKNAEYMYNTSKILQLI